MSTTVQSAALLVDGTTIQRWQRRVIKQVATETQLSFDLVVLNNGRDEESGADETTLFQTMWEMSVWEYYRAYRRRTEIPARSRHRLDELDCLVGADQVRCRPIPAESLGNELPADTVDRLREVDVAIRFGFGILKGEAIDAPTAGTLSLHGGDLRKYRGRPAGFWEFVNGDGEVGVTVQQIAETLDAGEIVAFETIDIRRLNSWPAVQQELFETAPELFVRAIENLNDREFTASPPEELGTLYTTPEATDVLRYVLRASLETLTG